MNKEFWNSRYGAADSAYGETPNLFFKQWLAEFPAGKMLMPADGEGRNGVYAAQKGWEVSAFDMSEAGKVKAEKLAAQHGLKIDYQVGEFSDISYEEGQFDGIGLIYAHFPAEVKSQYHKTLNTYLRPGGIVIFEAFSKSHLKFKSLNPKVGGPRDTATPFSIEEIKNDFENYEILELAEVEVELHEGLYHNGMSSVIRFVGRKK